MTPAESRELKKDDVVYAVIDNFIYKSVVVIPYVDDLLVRPDTWSSDIIVNCYAVFKELEGAIALVEAEIKALRNHLKIVKKARMR